MSRRTQLLILSSIACLLLVAFLVWLWWPKSAPPAPVVDLPPVPAPVIEQPPQEPLAPPISIKQEQTERAQASTIETLAKTFVERYGSFSTEADYKNVEDILPLVTTDFANRLKASRTTVDANAPFYGVTTRVLSFKTSNLTDATAALSVSTQREETKGSLQNTVIRYQTIDLTFQKVGTDWKIASASWQ